MIGRRTDERSVGRIRLAKSELLVHHEQLDALTKRLDHSSNRISLALVIAALLVASRLMVPQEGTVLGLFDLPSVGIFAYIVAGIIGTWLLVFIIHSDKP